ncbi:hypothetical protein HK098_004162 [Nowakowskiella sp. JEL0407]|nr:hypothetical protein HK098_004162 [Nowakowskiella sp. JEL0407]
MDGRTNKEGLFIFDAVSRDSCIRLSTPLTFDPDPFTPNNYYNLLALSQKYSYAVYATSTGFSFCKTSDIISTFQSAPANSRIPPESDKVYGDERNHVKVQDQVKFVKFTSDELYVVVGLSNGVIQIYDLRKLINGVKSFENQFNCGAIIKDIKPNPSGDVLAVVDINGKLKICKFNGENLMTKNLDHIVTAISWSAKGKQLAVGTSQGKLLQITNDGEVKNVLEKPADLDNTYRVQHILWLENKLFYVIYLTEENNGQFSHHTYENGAAKQIPEPFYDFYPHMFIECIKSWKDKYIVFHGMPRSEEISVIGCSPDNNWSAWDLDEAKRATVPLEDGDETHVLGLAVDLSNQIKVRNAQGEEETNWPVLFFLSDKGLLSAFWIKNLDAMRSGVNLAMVTSEQLPVSDSSSGIASSSKRVAEPKTNPVPAFGSASSNAPASFSMRGPFSSTSFAAAPKPIAPNENPFGSQETPTFGGNSLNPFSSESNSQNTAKPPFGKPNDQSGTNSGFGTNKPLFDSDLSSTTPKTGFGFGSSSGTSGTTLAAPKTFLTTNSETSGTSSGGAPKSFLATNSETSGKNSSGGAKKPLFGVSSQANTGQRKNSSSGLSESSISTSEVKKPLFGGTLSSSGSTSVKEISGGVGSTSITSARPDTIASAETSSNVNNGTPSSGPNASQVLVDKFDAIYSEFEDDIQQLREFVKKTKGVITAPSLAKASDVLKDLDKTAKQILTLKKTMQKAQLKTQGYVQGTNNIRVMYNEGEKRVANYKNGHEEDGEVGGLGPELAGLRTDVRKKFEEINMSVQSLEAYLENMKEYINRATLKEDFLRAPDFDTICRTISRIHKATLSMTYRLDEVSTQLAEIKLGSEGEKNKPVKGKKIETIRKRSSRFGILEDRPPESLQEAISSMKTLDLTENETWEESMARKFEKKNALKALLKSGGKRTAKDVFVCKVNVDSVDLNRINEGLRKLRESKVVAVKEEKKPEPPVKSAEIKPEVTLFGTPAKKAAAFANQVENTPDQVVAEPKPNTFLAKLEKEKAKKDAAGKKTVVSDSVKKVDEKAPVINDIASSSAAPISSVVVKEEKVSSTEAKPIEETKKVEESKPLSVKDKKPLPSVTPFGGMGFGSGFASIVPAPSSLPVPTEKPSVPAEKPALVFATSFKPLPPSDPKSKIPNFGFGKLKLDEPSGSSKPVFSFTAPSESTSKEPENSNAVPSKSTVFDRISKKFETVEPEDISKSLESRLGPRRRTSSDEDYEDIENEEAQDEYDDDEYEEIGEEDYNDEDDDDIEGEDYGDEDEERDELEEEEKPDTSRELLDSAAPTGPQRESKMKRAGSRHAIRTEEDDIRDDRMYAKMQKEKEKLEKSGGLFSFNLPVTPPSGSAAGSSASTKVDLSVLRSIPTSPPPPEKKTPVKVESKDEISNITTYKTTGLFATSKASEAVNSESSDSGGDKKKDSSPFKSSGLSSFATPAPKDEKKESPFKSSGLASFSNPSNFAQPPKEVSELSAITAPTTTPPKTFSFATKIPTPTVKSESSQPPKPSTSDSEKESVPSIWKSANVKGWKCDACLVQNSEEASKCISCETDKPIEKKEVTGDEDSGKEAPNSVKPAVEETTSNSSIWKQATAGWKCNQCLVQNKEDASQCVSCETKRPGTESKDKEQEKSLPDVPISFGIQTAVNDPLPKPNLTSKQPTQSVWGATATKGWKCSSCLVQNTEDATECVSCETVKPGAVKGKEKEKKPEFPVSFGIKLDGSSSTTESSVAAMFGGSAAADAFGVKKADGASTKSVWGSIETKGWKCPECFVQNKEDAANCVACETPMPKTAEGEEKTTEKKLEAPKFDFGAAASANVKAKDESTSKNVWGQSKKGWECAACLVSNKADTSECAACEAPRPGYETKKENSADKPLEPPKFPMFGTTSSSDASTSAMFGGSAAASAFGITAKDTKNETADDKSKSVWGKSSKGWKCDACLVQNKEDATECASCESAKPGANEGGKKADAIADGQPKFNLFGAQAGSSSTFGFGTTSTSSTSFGFGGTSGFGAKAGENENKSSTAENESTVKTAFGSTGGSGFGDAKKAENEKSVFGSGSGFGFGSSLAKSDDKPTSNAGGSSSGFGFGSASGGFGLGEISESKSKSEGFNFVAASNNNSHTPTTSKPTEFSTPTRSTTTSASTFVTPTNQQDASKKQNPTFSFLHAANSNESSGFKDGSSSSAFGGAAFGKTANPQSLFGITPSTSGGTTSFAEIKPSGTNAFGFGDSTGFGLGGQPQNSSNPMFELPPPTSQPASTGVSTFGNFGNTSTTATFGGSGFGSTGFGSGTSAFGSTSTGTTGFGSSAFGQPSFGNSGLGNASQPPALTSQPVFGSSNSGFAAQGGMAFGASGFGNQTSSTFGSSNNTPFGDQGMAFGSSGFGSSGFGSSGLGGSGFGSSLQGNGLRGFENVADGAGFGSMAADENMTSFASFASAGASELQSFGSFEGSTGSSGFGQGGSVFGQGSGSAFGQSSGSAFGQGGSAFGQGSSSAFGGQPSK